MKKSLLMKTMLLLFALIVGSTSAWAEDVTRTENFISSKATTNAYDCSSSIGTASNQTDWDYEWTPSGSGTVFKNGIKLGKSSGTGSVANTTMLSGIATGTSVTIKVYAAQWNTDGGSIKVTYNSKSETKEPANSAITNTSKTYSPSDFSNSTDFTITKVENVTSFTIASSQKRILIDKVEVVYNSSSLPSAGLVFPVSSFKVAANLDNFPTPTLTNPHNVTVTYSSDDEDIAVVDDNSGEILIGDKIGTATITATFAGNSTYAESSASYTITTYNPAANDGSEAKPYTVTEALALINILGTASSDPVYVKGIVSTGLTNIVNDPSKSYDGSATYYISADGTTSNQLMIYRGFNIGKTKFTAESDLSLGDEVMIYGSLKMYNTTPEFNSNNYIVQLKHGSEPEVKSLQVAAAEYRTYVATANLVVPAGVKAYIATSETASTLTLTSVAKIKEGTPVILNAAEGYYTFEITDDAVTYPATNLLKISDGTAVNGVFVLAKSGDNVGFYKWMGGALSAGRVYIDAPANAARDYLEFSFDGETTGIDKANSQKLTANSQYFDLQGRKVANPTKGLYIVNGKKVILH